MLWVLNNWRVIAVISIGISLFVFGHVTGANRVQSRWDEAIRAEQAEAVKAATKNLKVNAEVSDELQKKYAALRRRYDELVRMRSETDMPTVANTASGHHAATGTNGFHGNIFALLMQADLQTQQLIACQKWIGSFRDPR